MLKNLLRRLLKLLFRVEILGDPAPLRQPRTLIVANHQSLLDGVLLWAFLPGDPVFVVHRQVTERPLFRFLLGFAPHLAVDSDNPLAIKQIVRLVESGRPVAIFPEGRITRTGSLMKVYDGAARVAARTRANLVPIRIDGAARSFFGRLGGLFPRRLLPKIRLFIEPARTITPTAPGLRSPGEQLRRIMLDMLVTTRPRHTLFQAFLQARSDFGSRYPLLEDIRLKTDSYGSVLKMALGIARLLESRTTPGEVVGVLTPTATPTLGLLLGLTLRRRIPAMLNYTAGAEGLRDACTAAGIKSIVASRAFLEKANLTELVEHLPGIRVHYLEDLRTQLATGDRLWILLHLLFPHRAVAFQHPEDAALVLFTSGSEGKAKGVVHSHDSLLANVAQIRAMADFTPNDKFMMAMPLFHSFGLTCGALLPLIAGCKVFLYPSPLHYKAIPELVYDRDCNMLFGTSTFLAHYGRHAHPYDFGHMRYVVAGAERLHEDVRALWMDKFGIRILEGYGITECAPVVAFNVPMACRNGSVGQLLPGMDCELVPVPGIEEGGELRVKGPNLMKGYLLHERPGVLQPPTPTADWYATGDIVSLDEQGFLYIRGRLKRFAKIAGEMVSLEQVEKLAALAAPGFAHAASCRSDPARGEALVLFTTSPQLPREQLHAAARAQGAPELSVPRLVVHLDALPLLGSGKVDYVALQHLAEKAGTDFTTADEKRARA